MLLRKMLRDMRLNLTQFISIFVMALLGVFVYSGINAEWYGMSTEANRYYEDTALPDLWVISSSFTLEDVKKAESIEGIVTASRRFTADTIGYTGSGTPALTLNVVDDNLLSRPYVTEGEAFRPDADGIWLDASFAKANGIKPGDSIAFDISGTQISKIVSGCILYSEKVYNVKDETSLLPDPAAYGFAFLPRAALKDTPASELPYNELLLSIKPGWNETDVKEKLESLFSDRYHMILTRDTHPSVSMFQNEIDQNKAMGGIFPVAFFLIAALTMLTTMTRLTGNQRIQIGTLKAMGFSKQKILFHYVSYGVWIGLAGGVIGLFAGPVVIPPILFSMQKTMYRLPDWYAAVSPYSFIAVVIAVVCCGASGYFACRQQLREVPAAVLRPRIPRAGHHTSFEKSRLWHRFGFSAQWNLRDIMRSRIRSLMAVIGVTGCTALLLFGLGLRDTVNGTSDWMYGELNTYESKIFLSDMITEQELDAITGRYPGQQVQESNIELKKDNTKESGSLTVISDGDAIHFQDKKRNFITLPEEGIAISCKMAELMKISRGDTVQWRIYGEKDWKEAKITEIFRTPMGQGIAMIKAVYEQAGRSMKANLLLTCARADGADKLNGVKAVQDKEELTENFNSMLESMKMIIAILVLAAVILGSVVLYNLGVLSFTERLRELATLQVLGFFPRQIRSLLQKQNIWLTVTGILFGIPAGYALILFMLSTMPDTTDMAADVAFSSVLISIAVTFSLSMLVNLLLSGKIKSIDMVSSLKSVE